MKRKTLKFIACAAVMALTLSVTACGGSDDASDTDAFELEEADEGEEEEEEEEFEDEEEEEEEEFEEEDEEEEEEFEEEDEEFDEEEFEEDEEEAEDEEDASGDYETLEDYYNAPGIKEQMDQLAASMASDGVTMSVEVSGNEFFIIAKYDAGIELDDSVGEAIDQMMESFASVFEDMAASFDEAIGQEGACTVTVRYTTADDSVLSENSYTAN